MHRAAIGVALAGLIVAGCHRSKHYETDVEVSRMAVVRKDEAGKPMTLDFEFSYVDCPGAQIEVIRGDAAFATCIGKYKVGQKLRAVIDHTWNVGGHYEPVVRRVGECARVPDPDDEASFAMVRECEDWVVNGQRVGFQCNYSPQKALLTKCPWFARE